MPGILTIIEHRDGTIRKASLETLSEARRLAQTAGWPVAALLVGQGVEGMAAELGKYGAATVYLASGEGLAAYSSEGWAAAAAAAVEKCQPDAIFLAATSLGRDLGGRVAARLKVGGIQDVTRVAIEGGKLTAVRPVYSGKAFATVEASPAGSVVVTLRPNIFAAERADVQATTEPLPVSASPRAVVEEFEATGGEELDVAEADVIVSGGRGIKGAENFKLIRELADTIGAAVGASRAVVDAGWIDHSHQVGQTGKVVSPSLYVACGISGAIQHLAGMSSSKLIVAINKDPDAPIFKVADYGVVGDLFQVVPPMIEAIRQLKD
jgi:electron transfer flavoprotein alpha subunit